MIKIHTMIKIYDQNSYNDRNDQNSHDGHKDQLTFSKIKNYI